jgi:hypothetical protein
MSANKRPPKELQKYVTVTPIPGGNAMRYFQTQAEAKAFAVPLTDCRLFRIDYDYYGVISPKRPKRKAKR